MKPIERMLLLVDEGEAAERARDEALTLARQLGATLRLVHVLPAWTPPIADVPLADAVSQLEFDEAARGRAQSLLGSARSHAEAAGVACEIALIEGADPVPALCAQVHEAGCQLMVAGTGSKSLIWSLLGGDPVPGLIRRSTVPVLVCGPSDQP